MAMVDIWTWYLRLIQPHLNTVVSQLNPLIVISQTQNQITTKRPWWTSNSSANSVQGNNLFERQYLFKKESGTNFFSFNSMISCENCLNKLYFIVLFFSDILAGRNFYYLFSCNGWMRLSITWIWNLIYDL